MPMGATSLRPAEPETRKPRLTMKPTPSLPSPHELASGFSRVIREWFTADELAECVRRNASEEDPGICHSHDFYDANMAMAEAWELLTSLPCYGEGSPDGANALWDAAWNLAKASNFTL